MITWKDVKNNIKSLSDDEKKEIEQMVDLEIKKQNMKNIIYDGDRCLGNWYGVRCSLSPRWFVKTDDGYYRCQECKSVYKKNNDGTYTLIKEV